MTFLPYIEAALVLMVIAAVFVVASGLFSLVLCWWRWLMFQVDKSISEHTDATGL